MAKRLTPRHPNSISPINKKVVPFGWQYIRSSENLFSDDLYLFKTQ
ncbi:hypothetical protein MCC93_02370 [Morococcus cerebrosus]|uniref:Uncharacterized protein n=1 Tax=Morococcus cerebrosus TaxID=1056807 RepID=A0A0C1HFR0_9NEIS|nr:hypothetical protein MCC93_02370 [Morococcus cerebrosus]